ncbi:Predicted alpha-L-rhamnosidase [hydrothermal vent metagenome]|uniref:Predicted alpha-L-rhamnosidase n=1 Tax=hydrothermal vent metagenome TaxID=652676 RepID=A0A3B1BRX3_9ZZZZ
MATKIIRDIKKKHYFVFFILISVLVLYIAIPFLNQDTAVSFSNYQYLKKGFVNPPGSARPKVFWWWLNSYINKQGVTRDLEEMKKQGIGGALIFDASAVDRWARDDVKSVPVGPPFMSSEWREVFRHALKEAARLDLELGVSMTSGFNAGGPWVTPEYGQQELVWSEFVLEGPSQYSDKLPLPSGPIYDNSGNPLKYGEMEINNDLVLDESGKPIYYRDVAVLAIPFSQLNRLNSANKVKEGMPPGRLKHWALKSVHSFDYPEDKGFFFDVVYDNVPDIRDEPTIALKSIHDLTKKIDKNGKLIWTVPKGKWLILRFGYTNTGVMLQATNPKNKGLAMDHLSAEAANRQFSEIGKKIVEDVANTNGKSLKYLYLDSWEVRIANWTPSFLKEFRKRRGYDMTPYLPVLEGRIVENREISNRFLHDYRKTIGDCISDNYYGQFRKIANQNGLEFHSEMATTPIPVDMLKCLGRTDVPVSEFWAETDSKEGRNEPWERMFGKQAASAAHIYGSRLVAAEALTVIQKHWEEGPFQLKRTVDQSFCAGVNSLLIHTFTHSPREVGLPGYEYFAGTHFNPQITWWKQAHAFTDYIGRSQFLLQQGNFVADVCFYQGDQIPSFVPMKHVDPKLGPGYDYDVVNSEVILKRMSVHNGKIILPDSMQYRILVLPDKKKINPDILIKLGELIYNGAIVVGPKPSKAYGLTNYPESDSLVAILADSIWGDCDGENVKERQFGKGKVIWGKTPREILLDMGILPDFEYKSQFKNAKLDYIHRSVVGQTNNIEIYFIANLKKRWENVELTFRVKNMTPEIWNPKTGEIRDETVYDIVNDRTTIPVRLSPLGSVFVVFRKAAEQKHITTLWKNSELIFPSTNRNGKMEFAGIDILSDREKRLVLQTQKPGNYQLMVNDGSILDVKIDSVPRPIPVKGPWVVHFPPGWGAPDSAVFKKLISWTKSNETGIKYFSGTASYSTTFKIDKKFINKETVIFLNLGDVKEIAEITLNGKDLGILWKPPFSLNVTSAIKSGQNKLIVRVINLWPNRIIGDQFLPKEKRFTFTNIGKFTKDSPLLISGLLGPVNIFFTIKEVLSE